MELKNKKMVWTHAFHNKIYVKLKHLSIHPVFQLSKKEKKRKRKCKRKKLPQEKRKQIIENSTYFISKYHILFYIFVFKTVLIMNWDRLHILHIKKYEPYKWSPKPWSWLETWTSSYVDYQQSVLSSGSERHWWPWLPLWQILPSWQLFQALEPYPTKL